MLLLLVDAPVGAAHVRRNPLPVQRYKIIDPIGEVPAHEIHLRHRGGPQLEGHREATHRAIERVKEATAPSLAQRHIVELSHIGALDGAGVFARVRGHQVVAHAPAHLLLLHEGHQLRHNSLFREIEHQRVKGLSRMLRNMNPFTLHQLKAYVAIVHKKKLPQETQIVLLLGNT